MDVPIESYGWWKNFKNRINLIELKIEDPEVQKYINDLEVSGVLKIKPKNEIPPINPNNKNLVELKFLRNDTREQITRE